MARSDKPGMIDGFMSVQAVRRKGEQGPDNVPPQGEAPPATQEETRHRSADLEKKTSIGQTALPSRHELVCYSCGYAFVVTGKLGKVFCSKCREELETSDRDIEGNWKQDIRTVGRVQIKSGAVIDGATVIATDIAIAGDCSKANLQPTRRIELETGAIVPPGVLDAHPVLIRAGGRISLKAPLHCSNLDVHGELQAEAAPTGVVTIHPGGMFRGKLKTAHLIVHDGGGLSAKLHIKPEEQKTEGGGRKAETGGQKTAVRGQKAETGGQKAEDRKSEVGGQTSEGRRQKSAATKGRNTTTPTPKSKPKSTARAKPKAASRRVSTSKRKKRTSKPPSGKVE